MDKNEAVSVKFIVVAEEQHGQRLDNFLITKLKGLPKSRLYKALRKGEVRVNKKRIGPDYRLQTGDSVRIPPFRLAPEASPKKPNDKMLKLIQDRIIFEDNDLIILNKPAGIAVHGGSGVSIGIIEAIRALRPYLKFVELVHRLDRDTSGCLVLAKKSSILKEVHELLRLREVSKTYLMLVSGRCQFDERRVDVSLRKNVLKSGERIVVVDEVEGKEAITKFKKLKEFNNMTLLEAKPITGRTHQIRVHAAYLGHPILGDEKYGQGVDKALNIKQLCLHSASIVFNLASKNTEVGVCALLMEKWSRWLKS